MAEITPELLEQLKAQGHVISPETEQMVSSRMPAPNAAPTPDAPAPDAPQAGPSPAPNGVGPAAPAAPQEASRAVASIATPAVAASSPPQVKLASDASAAQPAAAQESGAQKGMNRATDLQQSGVIAEAKAESDKANAAAKAIDTMRVAQQKAMDQATVRRAEEDKKYEAALQERDKALSDFQGQHVDPDRLWNNRSTGQKVLAGIGMLLGSFGGQNGNAAVATIQSAIDKDIASQKDDIANKGKIFELKSGLLHEMRAKFQDDQQADAATRMAYMDQMKLQIEGIAQKYASPAIQAKAAQAIAVLQQEREKTNFAFEQATQAKMAQLRLNGGVQSQADIDIASLPEEQQKDYRARRVKGQGDGGIAIDGFAATSDRAKSLQEKVNTTQQATQSINELKKLGESGGKIPLSEARTQAEVLSNLLTAGLRTEVVGPGAVSATEWDILHAVVKNPALLTSVNAQAALSKLKSVLNRNMVTAARNEGLQVHSLDLGKAN
jgi:hypothetical protein